MGMPAMGYQNTGSVYGMNPTMAARHTMMGPMNPMFTGGSAFGDSQASGMFQPPMMPAAMGMGIGSNASASGGMGGDQRPMSTFSMATTMNPFAPGPSANANSLDEDLKNALRNYLGLGLDLSLQPWAYIHNSSDILPAAAYGCHRTISSLAKRQQSNARHILRGGSKLGGGMVDLLHRAV